MSSGIDDYERKRDFARTPEPAPGEVGARGSAPVFVVHRHDASRLHYDLRLEMEGVLRSWAVPKGFSFDPADKHLAVRTEDHPLEYEHFSGVIPKGQYGAGTMTIWDRGTYQIVKADSAPEAVASGELKVILSGRKLRGEWHLVRTKQGPNTWLLFKSKDRYAGPARDTALGVDLAGAVVGVVPEEVSPMEPGAVRAPFDDAAFVFEAGFEGPRVRLVKDGGAARVVGQDLPDVEAALREIRAERALLDGVLVDRDGALQVYAFDLLSFEELDLRPMPLVDRKAALRSLLPPSNVLLYMDHVPGNGVALADVMAAAGLTEVVGKRMASAYESGRSPDWVSVPVEPAPGGRKSTPRPPREASRVAYTNLDKVYWPAEGYTKGDLIHFYETVADALIPYLEDRPLHMHRFPDGIEGKSFYQKNVREFVPEWVETYTVESARKEDAGEYVVCNDADTLRLLANLGSIDLHPWMSRVASPDAPDYAVIDLDPKDAPFAHVIEIARRVGELLVEIGLRPLLKTSGKTGLHVHVPLAPGYTYDQSRMFCEGVARVVARDLPGIATVERVIGHREGKVYVDFGQNRRQQTIVPPYVVRPVRGATVSTPLSWDELVDDLTPASFTILTVPPRIEERGDLFAPLLEDRQDLLPAIERLQARFQGESA